MISITVAALLALPVGAAGWSAMGSIEPDTEYEASVNGGHNWQTAPGAATDRIYFQVFETSSDINPNVGIAGTLETRNDNLGTTSVYALLGVWRDCNGDGYIGLAESASLEYPRTLLQNEAICPHVSGPRGEFTAAPAYAAAGYPSNWNNWVTELVMIGADPGDPMDDARVIRDDAAKVWGDFGRPDDSAEVAGGTCAVTPLPRGTTRTTGGAINYFDCLAGRNLGSLGAIYSNWNDVFRGRTIAGQDVPGIDEGDSLGLTWENERDGTQGDHPLDRDTLGSDDSSHAAVRTTDCEPAFRLGDAWNSTGAEALYRENHPEGQSLPGHNSEVYTPAPALTGAQDPTVAGQVNQTFEEQDDCDTSNDDGRDVYGQLEGDFQGSNQGGNPGKIEAEWNFGFADRVRSGTVEQRLTLDTFLGTDPAGPSGTGAAFRTVGAAFAPGSIWQGDAGLIKRPNLIRHDVETGIVEPARAFRETFYAYVGANSTSKGFSLPGGGATAKYGAAQCGAFTSGRHNGWNCDPAAWYVNSGTGEPMPEPTSNGGFARVGQPYQLRDLDCYDNSNSLGIPLGTAAMGADPCQ